VLERPSPDKRRTPEAWHVLAESGATACAPLSVPLTGTAAERAAQQAHAAINPAHPALWHTQAAWIRPAALVRAMLAQPGIEWRAGMAVARYERLASVSASVPATAPVPRWRLFDATGQTLIDTGLLVLAAGFDTLALMHASAHPATPAPLPPLQALRGQVAYGPMPDTPNTTDTPAEDFPPWPVNGHGSLIARIPLDDTHGNAYAAGWITGSTFERDEPEPLLREADHAANLERLTELLPAAAAHLAPQFAPQHAHQHAPGQTRSWAAVRCTVPDRLPLVGPWTAASQNDPLDAPWLLTGLGARGLPLAVLCGEILAAWLHGEPLPIERRLSLTLRAGRRWGKGNAAQVPRGVRILVSGGLRRCKSSQ
jgi:tRNA 5-methylaminomethyl-2-thiouridine biosynthesis bifunctional protein